MIAPAGPPPAAELQAGLEVLARRGYSLRLLLPATPAGYLAGPDDQRLDLLHQALVDPEVGLVWAARGGYGVMRLLPRLPWAELATARPRTLCGFSDLTALLLPAWQRLPGWSCIHGPNVSGLGRLPPAEQEHLWALLEQGRPPTFAGLRTLVPGTARGPLLGGNLCLLAALAGTPYLPPVDGSLLVLEEVGERPYRLDRLLTQLGLAGWLERVSGVLLGHFAGCDEGAEQGVETAARRIAELLPGVPLLAGLPVGHQAANRAWPLGAPYLLDGPAGALVPAPASRPC